MAATRFRPPVTGLDRNALEQFRRVGDAIGELSVDTSSTEWPEYELPTDTNNFADPRRFGGQGFGLVPTGAARSLTGLKPPPAGFTGTITIINRSGTLNLSLEHNSSLSDFGALFDLPNGERLTLQPRACATLRYVFERGVWMCASHSAWPDDRVAINWEGTQNFISAANFSALATFNAGATVASGGLDVNGGGLDVNAGGVTVNAGGIDVNAGGIDVTGFSIFRNAVEFDAQVDFDADVDFNSTTGFTGTATFNGAIIGTGNWTHAAGNAVFSGTTFRVDSGTPAAFEDDVDFTAARCEFGVESQAVSSANEDLTIDDETVTLILTGTTSSVSIDTIGGTLWNGRHLRVLNMVTPGTDNNGVSVTFNRNTGDPDTARLTWNTNDLAGNLDTRRAQALDFVYTTQHTFSQGASWVLVYASNPG